MNSFYKELKRRNVIKSTLAYIVVCWVLMQVMSIVFPAFGLQQIWMRYLLIALIILLPFWIAFSWYYEITPEGFKKTVAVSPENSISGKTSDRLNYIIIGALAIAIVLVSVNIYQNSTNSENASAISSEEDNGEKKDQMLEKSVAVLAFADMSPKKDQEYFSDGISEEILNYLAKNDALRVISRTSSFSYKGKDADIKEIGEKLNANYVLEGSVRKADSVLRVTAQLINTGTGEHLWSETYDRKMNDIFKIQDEIAEAVSRNLHASLTGIRIPAVDTEAYTKYLQAREIYQRFGRTSNDKALELINESLSIDSSYAPSWLQKSKILGYKANFYPNSSYRDSLLINQINYAKKAIDRDVNYAEAYAYLGNCQRITGDYNAVKYNFEKAFELQPNSAEVIRRISNYPGLSPEDREVFLKKAIELDPLDELNYYSLSVNYIYQKDYEKALKNFDLYLNYLNYTPGDAGVHAEILAWAGEKEKAFQILEKETDQFSLDYSKLMVNVVLKTENADREILSYIDLYGDEQPYLVAQAYAYQNNKEEAYNWLEKAFRNDDPEILNQIWKDPYFDNLRQDKQFKDFVDTLDFPEPLDLELSKIKLKD